MVDLLECPEERRERRDLRLVPVCKSRAEIDVQFADCAGRKVPQRQASGLGCFENAVYID